MDEPTNDADPDPPAQKESSAEANARAINEQSPVLIADSCELSVLNEVPLNLSVKTEMVSSVNTGNLSQLLFQEGDSKQGFPELDPENAFEVSNTPSCSKVLTYDEAMEHQARATSSSCVLANMEMGVGDVVPASSNPESLSTGNDVAICKKPIKSSHRKAIVTRPIYPKKCSPVKRKLPLGKGSAKKRKLHLSEAEADQILEGMSDIEDILEGSALKNNLTAVNVKNILKSVITDPDVLNYVWNKMHGNEAGSDSLAALYEPKLTRSTVRKLCEGSGPGEANLSAVEDETVKLLGKELPENESSDEEYDPQKDPEVSEDEDNSMIASDIGSPVFSNTSCLTPAVFEGEDSKEASTTLDEFPELVIAEEGIDIIAQRTRSRLPLIDTSMEHLEAAFIAPDITTDMYDSDCGDEDWKQFLSDIYKHRPDPVVEVEDDNDDPEYNFFEEEDITDEWDFRNDRAVNISKKELNDLVAELIEATEGCHGEVVEADVPEDDEEEGEEVVNPEKPSVLVDMPASDDICELAAASPPLLISEESRALLAQQMRMHVQLLSQLFVLSSQEPALVAYQNGAKSLICELKCLSSKTFEDGSRSAFYANNLDQAVDLISSHQCPGDVIPSPRKKQHTVKYARGLFHPLPKYVQETIANSTIFIYPQLLPVRLLYHPWKSNKVYFTPAEDELIALGLEQFTPLRKQFPTSRLIQSLLVTCKSEQQIRVRLKNIKIRVKSEQHNPIKYYFTHGKTRPFQRLVLAFNPAFVVPPIKMPNEIIPDWLKTLKMKEQGYVPVSPSHTEWVKGTVLGRTPKCRFRSNRTIRSSLRSLPNASTPKRRFSFILPRLQPGATLTPTKHVSPLKHISPILKKYGYHRFFFRGALNISPKKQTEAARRPIAPKALPDKLYGVVKNLTPMLTDVHVISIPSPPATPEMIIPSLPEPEHPPAANTQDTVKSENSASFVEEDTSSNLVKETTEDQPESSAVIPGSPEQAVPNDPSNDGGSQSEIDTCEEEEEVQDNEGDLAALMAASSTILKNPLQLPKRTRQQKELESTLALLGADPLPIEEPLREEKNLAFAHAFLRRVKDMLVNDQDTFEAFLQVLLHFRNQPKVDPIALFQDIGETLHGYPNLVREFVAFLLPEQAVECNRFSDRFLFEKVLVFWRKLEVHFNRQPRQLKKLRRALMQLEKRGDFSSHALYSAVQPFLRNHAHLLEEFHGLLPKNKPAEILQNDFEEFLLPDSDSEMTDSNELYEEFVLPETEDLYGTAKCQCVCHQNSTDLRMKNRKRHCTKCGIRFIDGRVFLHVGKVLKPARVTCHYKPIPETPPRLLVSPPVLNSVTYPALDNQRIRNLFASPPREANSYTPIQSFGATFDTDTNSWSPSKLPPGKDLKARLESGISDLLTFPSQIGLHSESDSSDFPLSVENNNVVQCGSLDRSEECSWGKEEDKLLLETCQQMGTNDPVFQIVQSTLTHRSVKAIQTRFWELLQIFTANQKSDKGDHSEED